MKLGVKQIVVSYTMVFVSQFRYASFRLSSLQTMPQLPVILFDLGGVLVKSNGRSALRQLLPHMNDDEVLDRWTRSTSIDLFERGQIAEIQFATAFIKEWRLSMTELVFLQAFAAWVDGCLDGAMALGKL
jgi:phosphoglycolate phosphatase-like HAD superfamily hydrolase